MGDYRRERVDDWRLCVCYCGSVGLGVEDRSVIVRNSTDVRRANGR